jgi:NAD(P)-dependent dehydrogenase (short-subunit alcohol dehydrogenase family)
MIAADPLFGKSILIVGGVGLLGKEFCDELLSAQARVIIADINSVELSRLKAENEELLCVELDITNEEKLSNSAQWIRREVGRLDGIVISSGIDAKVSPTLSTNFTSLEKFSVEQWNQELESGLTGTFLLLKHFSSLLNPGSSIVVIASDLSVISPDQRLYNLENEELINFKPITYSVIKTGLIGLVRYLSTYLAPRDIRINAISPGGVEQDQPENFKIALRSRIPLGRLAKKNEYNKAVRFLLSDGSSYITGQNIVMDGGRSIW